MLKSNKIDIYWFSGSGNSALIAMKMQEAFRLRNYHTNLLAIENHLDFNDHNMAETLGIIFPIIAGTTYPLVWKFLKALPKTKERNVFLVLIKNDGLIRIMSAVKKILINKGYTCLGATVINMPTKLTVDPITNYDEKLFVGIKKSVAFVDDLMFETTTWQGYTMMGFTSILKYLPFLIHKYATNLRIDSLLCDGCQLCVKLCPVSAISLKNGYLELDDKLCESCFRCLHYCPKNAFTYKGQQLQQNQAVKVKMFLNIKDEN